MNKNDIKKFLDLLSKTIDRNIVIVDFANVDRWQDTLNWPVASRIWENNLRIWSEKPFGQRVGRLQEKQSN